MFCPNCGAENKDSKTPCGQCGFKLSSVSAPKFKGTMMLNSNAEVQALLKAHQAKQQAGESDAASESKKALEPRDAGRSSQIPRPAAGALRTPKRQLKGTMLGVAPQGGGGAVQWAVGLRDPSRDDSAADGPPDSTPATAASNAATLPSTPAAAFSPQAQPAASGGLPPASDSRPPLDASSADRTQVSPSAPPEPPLDEGEENQREVPPPVALKRTPPAPDDAPAPGSERVEEARPNPMTLSEPKLRSLVSPHATRKQGPSAMTGREWLLSFATLGVYALVRWLRLRRA